MPVKYFAYGSNMSTARLQARTPSARPIGRYSLSQHSLRFHNEGRDDSGKCDAFFTGRADDSVHGVLYELCPTEKNILDEAESLGLRYGEKFVRIEDGKGDTVEALMYYGLLIEADLKPYSWYLNHVLVGAVEAELHEHYVDEIRTMASVEDGDEQRAEIEWGVHG